MARPKNRPSGRTTYGEGTCGNCKKFFVKKKSTALFCSRACADVTRGIKANANRDLRVTLNCTVCKKEYKVQWQAAEKSKYCSYACKNVGQAVPRPDLQKRIEYTCAVCSKKWDGRPSLKHRKKYCSRQCNGIAQAMADQNNPTWIEVATEKALKARRFKYQTQFNTGKFVADFFIPSRNCVVECYGDYWHCNPIRYPNGPKDQTQRNAEHRDKFRLRWYKHKGYKVVILWESEIKEKGAVLLLAERLPARD